MPSGRAAKATKYGPAIDRIGKKRTRYFWKATLPTKDPVVENLLASGGLAPTASWPGSQIDRKLRDL